MNGFTLAWASIRSRPLTSLLSVMAMAAGIALLCGVFLVSQTIERAMARNARGIDIVAGVKGSPLQLVLAAVYHNDVPAGNITMADYQRLAAHPQIKRAIPLAVGDSYRGLRVVGTTEDYLSLYKAEIADGAVFAKPFQVVAGAATGLAVGTVFTAAHGLAADSDDIHEDHPYTVAGVLKPTGTVIDRLLLTSLESMQEMHEHGHHHEEEEPEGHEHEDGVTAVLLQVKNPAVLMNLPRALERSMNVTAAIPSYEMARLSKNLGVGRDIMKALGGVIVVLAGLILLAMLAAGLAARRYDLAVMRVLGARPCVLVLTIMAEALMVSVAGGVAGIIAGHGLAFAVLTGMDEVRGLAFTGAAFHLSLMDLWFLGLSAGAGLLAGLVPAVSAARTDIAGLLARGRT